MTCRDKPHKGFTEYLLVVAAKGADPVPDEAPTGGGGEGTGRGAHTAAR